MLETILDLANRCDDRIYKKLEEECGLPTKVGEQYIASYKDRSACANRGPSLDPDPLELEIQPL